MLTAATATATSYRNLMKDETIDESFMLCGVWAEIVLQTVLRLSSCDIIKTFEPEKCL